MLNIFICGSARKVKHDLLITLKRRRIGKRRVRHNQTIDVKQQLLVDEVNDRGDEVIVYQRETTQQNKSRSVIRNPTVDVKRELQDEEVDRGDEVVVYHRDNTQQTGNRSVIVNPTAEVKQQLHAEQQLHVKQQLHVEQQLHVDELQDLQEDELVQYYRELLQQVLQQEDQACSEFITDYTVLDVLVEAGVLLGKTKVDEILEVPSKAIARCQTGLVLLVEPMPSGYSDEEHRLECGNIAERYISLLNHLLVPFIELRDPSLQVMVKEVQEAIRGEMPLQTTRLQRFQRGMTTGDNISCTTNFAFFVSEPENCKLHIKNIQITEYESKQSWTSMDPGETRRFVARYGTDNLAIMSFDTNVKASVVKSMLKDGVTINGSLYSFLGCSSQGLKNRTCYLWKGTSAEAKAKLDECGDFDEIQSIPKRMARIGLLFSGVKLTNIEIMDDQIEREDDIKRKGNCFTDGCGAIGLHLAREVYQWLMNQCGNNPIERTDDPPPSVFQVRLQGYKGVLALDPGLGDKIKVRESMEKFQTSQFPRLGVCDYSRPYTFGNLNKQFIMLLSGLGVPDNVFLSKQKEYFDSVNAMTEDHEEAITILQWQNEFDIAQQIVLLKDTKEYPQWIKRRIVQTQEKLMSKFEKGDKRRPRNTKKGTKADKLTILVRNSRTIFGVCDPTGTLQYGECFVRLTVGDKPYTIMGNVVVCKNPCYLLGDVRVLTAVDKRDERLKCLVDCIVFPVKGPRPHCSEIAGSDLDGDQYFVTWDKDLIPPRTEEPYGYPGSSSPCRQGPIEYFSQQNAVQKSTAMVDRLYQLWANRTGVSSTQCRILGQMFSTVIDSGKTGVKVHIPKNLQLDQVNTQQPKTNVWTELMENASECLIKYKERIVNNQRGEPSSGRCSDEFVEEIIEEELTNITDFDKFTFALGHTGNITDVLDGFGRSLNFAFFSKEEKIEAFLCGVSKQLLENALNRSQLLLDDELSNFCMQTSHHKWCYFFEAGHDQFQWEHLLRALTENNRTFVVLSLPDSVMIVLQFLTPYELGLEQDVEPGTVTSYLYSRRFSYRKKYVLGRGYSLDLTKETMQLYRDKQKNKSFIWLNASDFKGKVLDVTLADENVNAVSIDLQRFGSEIQNRVKPHPLITKIPFQQIEVYAHMEQEFVPYFDTVEVNDAIQVPETRDEEQEVSDDISTTVENMLDCETDSQIQTVEDFLEKLQTDAENGRLLSFKLTIEEWKNAQNALPNETLTLVSLLLRNIVLSIPPVLLPYECKDIIVYLMQDHDHSSPKGTLEILGLLSKLGITNGVKRICKQQEAILLNRKCFLDVCSMWQSWWNLDKEVSLQFLSCLDISDAKSTFNEDLGEDIIDVQLVNDYINTFGKLQVLDFLQESESLKEKMKLTKGRCWPGPSNLELVHVDNDELSFTGTSYPSNITEGRFVTIARHQDHKRVSDHRAFICVGQILSIKKGPILIDMKIFGGVPSMLRETDTEKKGVLWRMTQLANISSHLRNIEALSRLTPDCGKTENSSPSPYLLQLLVHPEMPFENHLSGVRVDENYEIVKGLHQSQKKAVTDAIEHSVSLIQGPPGTGKTTVACRIIRTIFNTKKDYKILVVAETNLAVDNIVKTLNGCDDVKNDILRCGSDGGITIGYGDEVTTKGRLKTREKTSGKRTTYQDSHGIERTKQQQVKATIDHHRIVLTTSTGAGAPELKSFSFDFVLLDEATQTKETSLLCALTHGAKQLVMIGDPEQLGPVTPLVNMTHVGLPDPDLLSQTLYHRLFKILKQRRIFLDTQFRMHSSLMEFPSSEFYEGKLLCGPNGRNALNIVFPWPNERKRLCFINVDGQERRLGTSFYNQDEAEIIKKVLKVVLGTPEGERSLRLAKPDITILTLYQGQVSKLREVDPLVETCTVDGFQGRENDLIIISTVRANENGSLGFVDNRRRINVLLTRARRGLIVVGNEDTLKHSETWSKWLNDAPHLAAGDVQLQEEDSTKDEQSWKSRGQHGSHWNRGRAGPRQRGRARGRGGEIYDSNMGRGRANRGQASPHCSSGGRFRGNTRP